MERQQVETLFRKYYRRMYATAFGLLYDEQESKDVVSEVFASLLEKEDSFLVDRKNADAGRHNARPLQADNVGNYLLISVRNIALNLLRSKTNREKIEKLYVSSLSEDDNADEERLQQLLSFARNNLSDQDLNIFTMRFIDGKDYKEICATTGLSRISVWKHITKIKDVLCRGRSCAGPQEMSQNL